MSQFLSTSFPHLTSSQMSEAVPFSSPFLHPQSLFFFLLHPLPTAYPVPQNLERPSEHYDILCSICRSRILWRGSKWHIKPGRIRVHKAMSSPWREPRLWILRGNTRMYAEIMLIVDLKRSEAGGCWIFLHFVFVVRYYYGVSLFFFSFLAMLGEWSSWVTCGVQETWNFTHHIFREMWRTYGNVPVQLFNY